jgi:hypothetical protein
MSISSEFFEGRIHWHKTCTFFLNNVCWPCRGIEA